MEIMELSIRRNKSDLSILPNVAAYSKVSNTEACAKKLSKILANNIDNCGEGGWSQNLCELLSKKVNENEIIL